MPKQIDVQDQAILVLLDLKSQELVKAVNEQGKAVAELAVALEEYVDWLNEQIVRLDGER